MAQQVHYNKILKAKVLRDVATNNMYQASFLPYLQNAETEIKKLIVMAFWLNIPKLELKKKVMLIVARVGKQLPIDLHDKDAYLNGLLKKADKMMLIIMPKITSIYTKTKKTILQYTEPKNYDNVKQMLNSPKQVFEFLSNDENKKLWASQKGSVAIPDYEKRVKDFINKIAHEPMTTYEKGKNSISLWQKAELDIRYQNQMDKLDDLKKQGVEYCYISSHPNCSKRCEVWQGELVSLNKHAKNPQTHIEKYSDIKKSTFLVGKVDGIKCYSLLDIMAVVDKYGHTNNIINGYNCRHSLIKYVVGMKPVNEYSEEEIKKMREIEDNIRAMEREIRILKTKLEIDPLGKDAKKLQKIIEKKVEILKNYCESNGYAFYPYRINVIS